MEYLDARSSMVMRCWTQHPARTLFGRTQAAMHAAVGETTEVEVAMELQLATSLVLWRKAFSAAWLEGSDTHRNLSTTSRLDGRTL